MLRRVKGLHAPKRTRQLVSYCLVAVIKLMEITRVGARQAKEKCVGSRENECADTTCSTKRDIIAELGVRVISYVQNGIVISQRSSRKTKKIY